MANELRRTGAYRSGEVVLVLTHGVIARALTGNTVCHAVCYHQVARFYKGFGVALISVRHRKHAPTHARPHARPHGLRAPFVPIHLLRSSALSGLNSLCVRASVRLCVCDTTPILWFYSRHCAYITSFNFDTDTRKPLPHTVRSFSLPLSLTPLPCSSTPLTPSPPPPPLPQPLSPVRTQTTRTHARFR